MRVLVVSHACVVDVNQRIYRELARRGHSVVVVVPARWRHEYSPARFAPSVLDGFGDSVLPLPVFRPGSIQLHVYRRGLRSSIMNQAPHVVYLEEEPYSAAALQCSARAARRGIPVAFYSAQNIAKHYPWPVRLAERTVWRRSGMAICVTDSVVTALRERGYDGDVRVIPLPVEVSEFFALPPDPELRRRLGLRERVVGMVGRLSAEKGVRVLLEAFRRLPGRDHTSLLCLGGGPLDSECRAEPGVIVQPVAHRDVPKYLCLMDVVAMPSLTTAAWKEQFGRAAVEAMACGVPVVGSTSGEIPAIVTRMGGGVIVAENDPAALSAALEGLLRDPDRRRELGGRGRRAVAAQLSVEVVAGRLEEALRVAGARAD